MNRSNIGNTITNGVQTVTVAGTTGAQMTEAQKQRKLAAANSVLNNMTPEQQSQYRQYQTQRVLDEMNLYQSKGKSPFQHLTQEEAGGYQAMQADKMRKAVSNYNEERQFEADLGLIAKTEQGADISMKVRNDIEYIKNLQEPFDEGDDK